MRVLALIVAVLAVSCSPEPEPEPEPAPAPTSVPKTSAPDPYCGDGSCDEWDGEDEYNCIDCGFNPFTGCPVSGGFCGDGVCCGYEDMRSCWRDCSPKPYNPNIDPRDPGWIDPIPERGPNL
jgi:hypothetical protein